MTREQAISKIIENILNQSLDWKVAAEMAEEIVQTLKAIKVLDIDVDPIVNDGE